MNNVSQSHGRAEVIRAMEEKQSRRQDDRNRDGGGKKWLDLWKILFGKERKKGVKMAPGLGPEHLEGMSIPTRWAPYIHFNPSSAASPWA